MGKVFYRAGTVPLRLKPLIHMDYSPVQFPDTCTAKVMKNLRTVPPAKCTLQYLVYTCFLSIYTPW